MLQRSASARPLAGGLFAVGVGVCTVAVVLLGACASSGVSKTGPGAGPVSAAGPSGELPPLIDREIFFEDPEISGGQISPDGTFISFKRPYKGVLNVWVKRREQPFDAARPITADIKRPVSDYFWSEDGKYVLYVQDKGGDENFRIYAVDPAAQPEAGTGVPAARDLTPFPDVRAMILAVPEPTPGWLVVGLNDRDPQMHDVYRLEIATGKRELVFKNEANIVGFDVDLTGKLRLGQRMTADGGMEILRIDGQNGSSKLTSVYTCSQEESCGAVRFHKDGKRVYLITNKGRTDLSQLVLFDPATREEMVVEGDPEKQVDFGGAEFSDVTEELVATTYEADRLRVYPHEEKFRQDYQLVRKALPDGDLYFGSSTEDERLRLVSVTSDLDPGATYLYDRSTGKVELLYRPRPKLPTQHLAPMRAVRYNARDGNVIPAYLTVPKGSGGTNLPAIILPHGGPWARDTWGYDSFAQFLANRGYAVLQPNFRGSTGYGKKFLNLGNKQWGTGYMQHDLTDGVSWLIEQGITKSKRDARVAIMGGSYGGFATLAGVTFTPEVYAAGVDIVGPSSIPTLLASIPPYWAPMKKLFSVRVGDPDDPTELAKLKAQSPLYSAKKIKAPLLVIQGANDPRVKQAESDQIVVALRDAGRPVEYLVAPDEGHGFRGQENRIAMFASIERFLAKHLGGRFQPTMPAPVAQKLAAITVDVNKVVAKPAQPSSKAVAAPVVAPAFAGATLRPATLRYTFKGESMGQPVTGTTTLTIAGGKRDRRPVWTIAESTKTAQGKGSDTTVLDKETLLPLDRKVRQGATTLDLAFSDKEVSGKMKAVGEEMPIFAKLEGGAVLSDGMPLNLALATLPLKLGYVTQIRSFELLGGKTVVNRIEVKAVEPVATPAGTFAAYRVLIAPEDGSAGSSVVWIEEAGSHRVLKWERTMPGAVGGGKMSAELVSGAAAARRIGPRSAPRTRSAESAFAADGLRDLGAHQRQRAGMRPDQGIDAGAGGRHRDQRAALAQIRAARPAQAPQRFEFRALAQARFELQHVDPQLEVGFGAHTARRPDPGGGQRVAQLRHQGAGELAGQRLGPAILISQRQLGVRQAQHDLGPVDGLGHRHRADRHRGTAGTAGLRRGGGRSNQGVVAKGGRAAAGRCAQGGEPASGQQAAPGLRTQSLAAAHGPLFRRPRSSDSGSRARVSARVRKARAARPSSRMVSASSPGRGVVWFRRRMKPSVCARVLRRPARACKASSLICSSGTRSSFWVMLVKLVCSRSAPPGTVGISGGCWLRSNLCRGAFGKKSSAMYCWRVSRLWPRSCARRPLATSSLTSWSVERPGRLGGASRRSRTRSG